MPGTDKWHWLLLLLKKETLLLHPLYSYTMGSCAMQIAKAAVRAEENAQLQQPQDAAASGTGKDRAEKGDADQLAAGGGIRAPVKVRSSFSVKSNRGKRDFTVALLREA